MLLISHGSFTIINISSNEFLEFENCNRFVNIQGMVHREPKVNIVNITFKRTAFERFYFNKVQKFSKETSLHNVAK